MINVNMWPKYSKFDKFIQCPGKVDEEKSLTATPPSVDAFGEEARQERVPVSKLEVWVVMHSGQPLHDAPEENRRRDLVSNRRDCYKLEWSD